MVKWLREALISVAMIRKYTDRSYSTCKTVGRKIMIYNHVNYRIAGQCI